MAGQPRANRPGHADVNGVAISDPLRLCPVLDIPGLPTIMLFRLSHVHFPHKPPTRRQRYTLGMFN
jgi:hypothetical protein